MEKRKNKRAPEAIHVRFAQKFLAEWTEFREAYGLTQRYAVENAMRQFMANYKRGA